MIAGTARFACSGESCFSISGDFASAIGHSRRPRPLLEAIMPRMFLFRVLSPVGWLVMLALLLVALTGTLAVALAQQGRLAPRAAETIAFAGPREP
jgi:hypothetical protein